MTPEAQRKLAALRLVEWRRGVLVKEMRRIGFSKGSAEAAVDVALQTVEALATGKMPKPLNGDYSDTRRALKRRSDVE